MMLCSQRSKVLKKSSNGNENINKPWAAVRSADCNCLHYSFNYVRRNLCLSLCDVRD